MKMKEWRLNDEKVVAVFILLCACVVCCCTSVLLSESVDDEEIVVFEENSLFGVKDAKEIFLCLRFIMKSVVLQWIFLCIYRQWRRTN